jgi:hypothetical protein
MGDAVFVIRNQLGQYWTRSSEWVDGREPQRLLKLRHHDEAVNQLVELSSKDVDLRGEVLSCTLSERGEPVVEPSAQLTPTLAEKAAAEKAAEKARQQAQADMLAQTEATSEETEVAANEEAAEAEEPPLSAAV